MPKEFLWLYTALDPAAADLRPTLAQRLNRPASRAVIEERREPELCQREGQSRLRRDSAEEARENLCSRLCRTAREQGSLPDQSCCSPRVVGSSNCVPHSRHSTLPVFVPLCATISSISRSWRQAKGGTTSPGRSVVSVSTGTSLSPVQASAVADALVRCALSVHQQVTDSSAVHDTNIAGRNSRTRGFPSFRYQNLLANGASPGPIIHSSQQRACLSASRTG